MENHDIEIEIGKDGKIRAKVSGAKGKACLKYMEFLAEVIGKLQSREFTSEYYEPETRIEVEPLVRRKQRR